jgi:hypothetical protein
MSMLNIFNIVHNSDTLLAHGINNEWLFTEKNHKHPKQKEMSLGAN